MELRAKEHNKIDLSGIYSNLGKWKLKFMYSSEN